MNPKDSASEIFLVILFVLSGSHPKTIKQKKHSKYSVNQIINYFNLLTLFDFGKKPLEKTLLLTFPRVRDIDRDARGTPSSL